MKFRETSATKGGFSNENGSHQGYTELTLEGEATFANVGKGVVHVNGYEVIMGYGSCLVEWVIWTNPEEKDLFDWFGCFDLTENYESPLWITTMIPSEAPPPSLLVGDK